MLKRAAVVLALAALPAAAQTTDIDAFKDAPDEGKVHSASGFVCPKFIGRFERNAYGERFPSIGADYCAYSAIDGVYGTITLTPLTGPYNAKEALAQEFREQEGIGGKMIAEGTVNIGGGATPIAVYSRSYETARLENLRYRIQFSSGTIGTWAVEATVEYATPRDDQKQRDFLNAVFTEALVRIAKTAPPTGPLIPAEGIVVPPVAPTTPAPAPATPAPPAPAPVTPTAPTPH